MLPVVAQAGVALVLYVAGNPSPWLSSAAWWTVYGTFSDIGCLLLIAVALRREGGDFRSFLRLALPASFKDIPIGFGWFLLVFPLCAIGGSMLAAWAVFGNPEPPMVAGQLADRSLPLWGVIYSLLIWWPIWSVTEQLTYQGYLLPRLSRRSGHMAAAVALIVFWWALQHSFFPLILDRQYMIYRFLAFMPIVLAFVLIYLRIKRLAPMIFAHALMDLSAAYWTLFSPPGH